MTTVKQIRNGAEFPTGIIYAHKPYVMLGGKGLDDEEMVLWAGTEAEFRNDPAANSKYYRDCVIEVREHDLAYNDNTKING